MSSQQNTQNTQNTQKKRRQKQTIEEQRQIKKRYRELISNTEADRQALLGGSTAKLVDTLKEGSSLFKNGWKY